MLSEVEIRNRTTPDVERRIASLDVFDQIDSTSNYLLDTPSPDIDQWHFAIANRQTAGRGRGGKRWHSPAGGGLWLSGAYTFAALPQNLSALTLALGVGVANALGRFGLADARLKWPNDLLVNNRKLGGILIDSTQAGGAYLTVVCGVGINVNLGTAQEMAADIIRNGDLPATDLRCCLPELPSMAELAGSMIDAVATTTDIYIERGFDAFADDWARLDWLRGRRLVVTQQNLRREGIAVGIAANGALILRDGEETFQVVSGTVRPIDDANEVA